MFCFRLANPDSRDAFGIIVSYAVKVKLFLGALGGELSAELPFILMHPKVSFLNLTEFSHHPSLVNVKQCDDVSLQPGEDRKLIHADSQADVEMFRQDTVDPDNELEPLWKN